MRSLKLQGFSAFVAKKAFIGNGLSFQFVFELHSIYVCHQVNKAAEMIDQLQDKLPGSSAEKASKAELLTLLDHHDTLVLELEQQQSALGMLRQQALSLLQDGATQSPGEEPPAVREITAMQDRCLK